MAASPEFKVYDPDGKYQAATKDTTLAAVVVGVLGDGATVRYRHGRVLWTEGFNDGGDGFASDSYDEAAATMDGRLS